MPFSAALRYLEKIMLEISVICLRVFLLDASICEKMLFSDNLLEINTKKI